MKKEEGEEEKEKEEEEEEEEEEDEKEEKEERCTQLAPYKDMFTPRDARSAYELCM